MNVTSSGIIGGVIGPQYGGHGTQFNENGIPTYSLPFTVENAPQKTVSPAIVLEDVENAPQKTVSPAIVLEDVENAPQKTVSPAIVLEDKDAYPVTGGFAWIHWLAANITRFEIKENESQTADDFV